MKIYVYASERSERATKLWNFYILKVLFLSIFCRYKWYACRLTCTDKFSNVPTKPRKSIIGGGGGGSCPPWAPPPPPLAMLVPQKEKKNQPTLHGFYIHYYMRIIIYRRTKLHGLKQLNERTHHHAFVHTYGILVITCIVSLKAHFAWPEMFFLLFQHRSRCTTVVYMLTNKQKKKEIAQFFARILPKFCPNLVRFLPMIKLAILDNAPPPPPNRVIYAYDCSFSIINWVRCLLAWNV